MTGFVETCDIQEQKKNATGILFCIMLENAEYETEPTIVRLYLLQDGVLSQLGGSTFVFYPRYNIHTIINKTPI